jgi:hypothetical protein
MLTSVPLAKIPVAVSGLEHLTLGRLVKCFVVMLLLLALCVLKGYLLFINNVNISDICVLYYKHILTIVSDDRK